MSPRVIVVCGVASVNVGVCSGRLVGSGAWVDHATSDISHAHRTTTDPARQISTLQRLRLRFSELILPPQSGQPEADGGGVVVAGACAMAFDEGGGSEAGQTRAWTVKCLS